MATMFLDGLAVSPENVTGWLQEKHDQKNDPYYKERYTLKTDNATYTIDAHGLIRDRGKFEAEHWITTEYHFYSMDGTCSNIAYDEIGLMVSCYILEPWEAAVLGHRLIGVYVDDYGFVGYYNEPDGMTDLDAFVELLDFPQDEDENY